MSIWVVLGAAIASWMFGAAYYISLSKPWLDASAFPADVRARIDGGGKQSPLPYVISIIAEIVMALVLALLIRGVQSEGVIGGILMGVTCWLGFVLTTQVTTNAYGMRKPMLTLIDAVHWLGVLVIQGGILGYFAR